ncbi:MAG: thioredoxin domain-containing protein [Firmicutes bacterium]|nr:thioredoxin domain-containing protein [Bacillota bacterium]
MDSSKTPNRLIHEKSPYLLQHAYNPVDWYPWGDEAFAKAKEEDKPIFLSIGYSTCHWCHVMERESFEDQEVADVLNRVFVCIKVDREERPDLDNIYMSVCQAITGSGGWPLTIFMMPDKRPFFAGTYFPKETKYGRMGILELARRIEKLWQTGREDLTQTAQMVMDHLQATSHVTPGKLPGEEVLHTAFQQLAERFDSEHGGFSTAPKFPTPHNLTFLLRYWKRTGNEHALTVFGTIKTKQSGT